MRAETAGGVVASPLGPGLLRRCPACGAWFSMRRVKVREGEAKAGPRYACRRCGYELEKAARHDRGNLHLAVSRGAPDPYAVRDERPGDEAAIHAVHAAAFPTDAEARLVDALRAAGNLRGSLVAVERGAIVGHVAFSPVTLPGATDGWGLAPVAVLSDHRRRGVAARLVRAGLAACERAGVGFVVVLGDPAYYGRFGFRPASDWNLRDEYGGGDASQALELRAGSIPAGGGLVQYAPEFADLE